MSVAALFLAWPVSLTAQDAAVPAHVAFIEGSASLDREGQSELVTAGVPFLAGDRLRTDAGRVEVLFPDGSALAVDQYSTIELLSPTLLRVTDGRVMLVVAGAQDPGSALRYQIDTPVASASTDGPGDYRVALLSGPAGLETELAVLRGLGLLRTEQGSTAVRAGERSLARDFQAPSFPQIFNSARFDAFDRWATLRRDARMGTAQSAQYLPSELRMYGGTFDRYGAWQLEPQYGYVWYPAAPPDWRPYYNGYWSVSGPYGWTWVGLDAWGWPTHHYGRWGFSHSRWFWIPATQWGPAWVTWGAAPGYVSWCPLGFDNGPVFAFSARFGNPWRGWVALSRTHFGAPGAYVHRYAVSQLPANTPVVLQAAAPQLPRRALRTAEGVGPRAVDVAVPRTQNRDVAIPRGSGYAAYGRVQSAVSQPPSKASLSPAARRSAGVSVPRSAPPDALAEQTGRRTAGFTQAIGRSPAANSKQPLAEAPAAFRRNPAAAFSQRPSEPAVSGTSDGAFSRQASPWYGQTSPWYGGARRAAQPGEANAAAAATEGQRRSYAPGPAGAQAPIAPAPQPVVTAPQRAMPRWSTPASGSPSGVQRAQPIYATPPTSPSTAPQPTFGPSPTARTPGAIPRGYAPSASPGPPPGARTSGAVPRGYAPSASPGPPPGAPRTSGAVPRGYVPSASPGPPPSATPAPAREASPQHAPAARRPS